MKKRFESSVQADEPRECLFARNPALFALHRFTPSPTPSGAHRLYEQTLGITEETKALKAREKAAYEWELHRRRGENPPLSPPAPAPPAAPTPPHLRRSSSTSFAIAGGGAGRKLESSRSSTAVLARAATTPASSLLRQPTAVHGEQQNAAIAAKPSREGSHRQVDLERHEQLLARATELRKSIGVSAPLQLDSSLLDRKTLTAGAAFNNRATKRSLGARVLLRTLGMPQPPPASVPVEFNAAVGEVRRNRFTVAETYDPFGELRKQPMRRPPRRPRHDWRLDTSIWAPRLKFSNSKDFYESEHQRVRHGTWRTAHSLRTLHVMWHAHAHAPCKRAIAMTHAPLMWH